MFLCILFFPMYAYYSDVFSCSSVVCQILQSLSSIPLFPTISAILSSRRISTRSKEFYSTNKVLLIFPSKLSYMAELMSHHRDSQALYPKLDAVLLFRCSATLHFLSFDCKARLPNSLNSLAVDSCRKSRARLLAFCSTSSSS